MNYDFDVNWTLEDARMFSKKEIEALKKEPTSNKRKEDLREKGKMYTSSLRALNEFCRPEVALYRYSLISHSSKEVQNELLDNLYEKYSESVNKSIITNALSSVKNFFDFVFH